MNPIKFASIASIFAFACIVGCSSDDSESSPTNAGDGPKQTSVDVVSGCEEITNEKDKAEVQAAKKEIVEVFSTFGKGDLTKAQALSAETKETFRTILTKYPGNCEAQLGFVASIISDISNNKDINSILDTIYKRKGMPKSSILSGNVEDVGSISLNFSLNSTEEMRGIPVKKIQSAIASVIPSLDSAITYMTNIANDDQFSCTYDINDRTVELDRGEFAPALAALFVAKAGLTSIVSLNFDIDDDGNYDWIDSLEDFGYTFDYENNYGIKHLAKLVGKDSKFTSVQDSWKSEYKNIPNLLDSAITYVQFGIQYGLEEAKTGITTQQNDLYIVGNDEFSDLSTKDAQKIIDSLDIIREKLKTGFDIPYAEGKKIKVNFSKFFENTDGTLKFLPYHVLNDNSKWDTPDGGFYWSDEVEYQAYAQRYMQRYIMQEYHKFNPESQPEVGSWEDGSYNGTIWLDAYDPNAEVEITYEVEGCKVNFTIESYLEGYNFSYLEEEDIVTTTWTIPSITLPEGMCKTEGGKTQYATAYIENEVPNILYFTDKNGNKTYSLQDIVNGVDDDGDRRSYTLDELSKIIIFPDITFGGVLPDMTVEMFWNEFLPAIIDDDDDYSPIASEESWMDDDWDY